MIEELKNVDLVGFVEREFGVQAKSIGSGNYRVNPAPCCSHNECFTIYGGDNKWKCFSCEKRGDASDLLIASGRASTLPDALKYLGIETKKESDYSPSKPSKSSSSVTACDNIQSPSESQETALEVKPAEGESSFFVGDTSKYFKDRGLSDSIIAKYGLRIEGNFAVLPGGIRRSISGEKQYLNPKGQTPPTMNLAYLKERGMVFICEGVFDALSIEEMGFRAIALNSASNVSKFIEELKKGCKAFLYAAFDADEAGKKASDELKKFCQTAEIGFSSLPIKGGLKDINEWLCCDRPGLAEVLAKTDAFRSQGDILSSLLSQPPKKYIPTGSPKLDKALGGGLVADLYVVGGVPASGKSAFVLQVAQGISQSGRSVLYFSLELSEGEIVARNLSRVSYQQDNTNYLTALEVNSGNMTEEKRALAFSLMDVFSHKMRGFCCPSITGQSVEAIREETAKYQYLTGESPVVIVDYLQNLRGKEGQSEKQVIDDAVIELKRLSNRFSTPVIVVSSLNREGYSSGGMASYKESGSIEYTAAVAIQIRPTKKEGEGGEYTLKKRKDDPTNPAYSLIETEIEIVKNRNYTSQSAILHFAGAGNCFCETNYQYTPSGK